MSTVRDVINGAFDELLYLAQGQAATAADMQSALAIFQRMVNELRRKGIIAAWPSPATGLTYQGAWRSAYTYAVNDVVSWAGDTFTCILAHTSSPITNPVDRPQFGINQGTYWSKNTLAAFTLNSAFPLDASCEDAVMCMLAVRIAPTFDVPVNTGPGGTAERAREGLSILWSLYADAVPQELDSGLVTTTGMQRLVSY